MYNEDYLVEAYNQGRNEFFRKTSSMFDPVPEETRQQLENLQKYRAKQLTNPDPTTSLDKAKFSAGLGGGVVLGTLGGAILSRGRSKGSLLTANHLGSNKAMLGLLSGTALGGLSALPFIGTKKDNISDKINRVSVDSSSNAYAGLASGAGMLGGAGMGYLIGSRLGSKPLGALAGAVAGGALGSPLGHLYHHYSK